MRCKKFVAALLSFGLIFNNVACINSMTMSKVQLKAAAESVDALRITKQPENVTVEAGSPATFSIEASGDNISYQWQSSSDGVNWRNCGSTGNKTESISFTATNSLNGKRMRCAVSNGTETIYSDVAVLTIGTPVNALRITKQPDNVTVEAGKTATFSIEASGDNISYQWQSSSDGVNWRNCSSTGNKTESISFKATNSLNGKRMRCAVSNGTETIYSDVAVLTIGTPVNALRITKQPEDVAVEAGKTATFSIEASGDNISYQWQSSSDGVNWRNCSSTGNKTESISFTATNSLNGKRMRCAVSNGTETIYSDVAVLTIGTPVNALRITKQPEDVAVEAGKTATFSIEASGDNISYQWQSSSDGVKWRNCTSAGNKTESISFTATNSLNGKRMRCAVSNGTETLYSDVACLNIITAVEIGSDLTYTYNAGILTISGTGYFYDVSDTQESPFTALMQQQNLTVIDQVVVEEGVEGIGAYIFNGIPLNSVTLPESCRIIGKNSFLNTGNTTVTVKYPAMIFSNDSGLGSDDTIVGFAGSSAEAFASENSAGFMSLEAEENFDDTPHEFWMHPGETLQLPAVGPGARYVSAGEWCATVDASGSVTAQDNTGTAKIYAYSIHGKTQVFEVHVSDENQEFYLPSYVQLCPGQQYSLECGGTPFDSFISSQDAIELIHSGGEYYKDIHAQKEGTCEVVSMPYSGFYGSTAVTLVNAAKEVIPAKSGLTYTGSVQRDGAAVGGLWYAFESDQGDTEYDLDFTDSDSLEMIADFYRSLTISEFYYAAHDTWEHSLIGGWDLETNSGHCSFTVPAGETYYLWLKSFNDSDDFNYSMTVEKREFTEQVLSDNECYTVTGPHFNHYTTLSFNVPEDGTYLIEGIASEDLEHSCIQVSNTPEFAAYEDGLWEYTLDFYGTEDNMIFHYPTLTGGETIYLRVINYGDDELDDSDYVTVRVHKVDPNESELTVNAASSTAMSYAPDDCEYRTLTTKGNTQYWFKLDSDDAVIFLWDEYGNPVTVEPDTDLADGFYYFYSSTELTYRVQLLPKNRSNMSGTANLYFSSKPGFITWKTITPDTPEEVHFEPGAYEVFAFTPETTGMYTFTSSLPNDDYCDTAGILYSDDLLSHETSYDDESAGNGHFRISAMLEAGKTVYLVPTDFQEDETADFLVTAELASEATIVDLSDCTVHQMAFNDMNEYTIYQFTAPQTGEFLFTANSSYPMCYELATDIEFRYHLYMDGIEDTGNATSLYYQVWINEGETVYWRFYPGDAVENPTDYYFNVSAAVLPNESEGAELNTQIYADGDAATIALDPLENERVFFVPETRDVYTLTVTGTTDTPFTIVLHEDNPNYDDDEWVTLFASSVDYDEDLTSYTVSFNAKPGYTYWIKPYPCTEITTGDVTVSIAEGGDDPINEELYIPLNGSVSGTVGQPVWCVFEVTEDQPYAVYDIVKDAGGREIFVDIYQSDKMTPVPYDSEPGDDMVYRRMVGLTKGVYYACVSTYSSEPVEFGLSFIKEECATSELRNSTPHYDFAISATTVQWLSFQAPENLPVNEYHFTFNGQGQEMNVFIYSYDEESEQFRERDQYGRISEWEIDCWLEAGETIYFLVDAVDMANDFAYNLTIEDVPNSFATLNLPEEYGEYYSTSVNSCGYDEWIKINNPAENNYSLAVVGGSNKQFTITLYNGDGVEVISASGNSSADFADVFSYSSACGQKYYLHIVEENYLAIEELEIRFTPSIQMM